MTLKSEIIVTEDYKTSSKFEFWKTLRKGDRLTISLALNYNRRGDKVYQPKLEVRNHRNNEGFITDYVKMQNYLKRLEYNEI